MALPQALELFRQAMAASRQNDKAKTRQLLIEATRLDPGNEVAWQWLAGVAETPLEATTVWEKVLALNANNDKARVGIRPVRLQAGIQAAKEKDVPTARRLLRAVVADDPGNEHGWLWLASVCDSPKEAMAHLKRVLAINPGNKSAKKGVEYYEAKLAGRSGGHPAEAGPPSSTTGDAGRPTDVATRPDAATADAEPRKLLAIDASRTNRKLLGLALSQHNFSLSEAEDADDAIDRIRDDGVPDLIVADAKMGGMDAYEFCKLLRQHPDTRKLPVFLFTGGDGIVDRMRAKMAGVTAVLTKPLQPEAFAQAVRTHCRPETVAVG